jgi:hypothetical protein
LQISNVKAIFREVTDLIQGNRARYEIRGNAEYDTPAGLMTFPVSDVPGQRDEVGVRCCRRCQNSDFSSSS